ncbi:hypothetical protein [Halomonas huangheensis]|uniref:Uncharacterized protein n=1 Tax=Halomonas huangheensis TaxID=1178482 RepID=W1N9R1_9GAMM|nr:hypothetical protein [Halomonas huangheensis]ALM53819.1 hypothetical protein AR456_17240 [Halomonas huangheensis]ERL52244.1 hypothetical protein BJB45_09770 [Halomonas huangheensis]
MATTEPTNAPGVDPAASANNQQQQAFDQAAENARAMQIVGQAVASLASTQLMDYAGDMLKDEG